MSHESEYLVRDRWYALIVAGPSGSGKSIVAEQVGRELSLPVIDAGWSNLVPSVVPEPSTYALLAVGCAGLPAVRRRK